MGNDQSPWRTKEEAAAYLRCSQATVSRYMRRGELKAYKLAGTQSVRFKVEDLEALLAQPAA